MTFTTITTILAVPVHAQQPTSANLRGIGTITLPGGDEKAVNVVRLKMGADHTLRLVAEGAVRVLADAVRGVSGVSGGHNRLHVGRTAGTTRSGTMCGPWTAAEIRRLQRLCRAGGKRTPAAHGK
jgi:hypothetical protein